MQFTRRAAMRVVFTLRIGSGVRSRTGGI